jgi:hypothetical protein
MTLALTGSLPNIRDRLNLETQGFLKVHVGR